MTLNVENYIGKGIKQKSVVVRGPKSVLNLAIDDLKALGGKWNRSLKGGPGWIFPEKMKVALENFLASGKALQPPTKIKPTLKPDPKKKKEDTHKEENDDDELEERLEKIEKKLDETLKKLEIIQTLLEEESSDDEEEEEISESDLDSETEPEDDDDEVEVDSPSEEEDEDEDEEDEDDDEEDEK